jgi:hypothetical protein
MSMASRTFTHRFDDLPLIVEGPFEDNGLDGEAEISYFPDGEWTVTEIGIRVGRYKTAAELEDTGITSRRVYKIHLLDKGDPLFNIILHRLENERRRDVERDVADQIAEDREWAADCAADYRLEDRKHWVAA